MKTRSVESYMKHRRDQLLHLYLDTPIYKDSNCILVKDILPNDGHFDNFLVALYCFYP